MRLFYNSPFLFKYFFLGIFLFPLGVHGSLPEPFETFGFGPKFGDTFNNKAQDSCSFEQQLSRSFKFGTNRHSSLYVCTNGLISFEQPVNSHSPEYFESFTSPVIAVFFADIFIAENFLDAMCFENEGALYNAPYNYSPERVCWYYWNSDPDQSFNGLDMGTDYIEDPFLKHSVEVFEGQTFYQSSLSESFDDELTLQVMGLGNTKYVNLANNIMKREMSQLDLAQATLFLKERNPSSSPRNLFFAKEPLLRQGTRLLRQGTEKSERTKN